MSRAEQLAKIPEAISREAYTLLVETALPGIDLSDILELRFSAQAVTASVLAVNAEGQHFPIGDEIATHDIVIPVVDGAEGGAT